MKNYIKNMQKFVRDPIIIISVKTPATSQNAVLSKTRLKKKTDEVD